MKEELLKRLVFGIIANNWVIASCKDGEPEKRILDEYYISAIKTGYNAGYDSGSFDDIDDEILSAVYNELTGLELNDLLQENADDMDLAIAQNRSLLGLDQ